MEVTLPRLNIGDVAGPLLIRLSGREVALQHVGHHNGESGCARPMWSASATDASNVVQPHQPGKPVPTDPQALRAQVSVQNPEQPSDCRWTGHVE